jgi:hypothetical protein
MQCAPAVSPFAGQVEPVMQGSFRRPPAFAHPLHLEFEACHSIHHGTDDIGDAVRKILVEPNRFEPLLGRHLL